MAKLYDLLARLSVRENERVEAFPNERLGEILILARGRRDRPRLIRDFLDQNKLREVPWEIMDLAFAQIEGGYAFAAWMRCDDPFLMRRFAARCNMNEVRMPCDGVSFPPTPYASAVYTGSLREYSPGAKVMFNVVVDEIAKSPNATMNNVEYGLKTKTVQEGSHPYEEFKTLIFACDTEQAEDELTEQLRKKLADEGMNDDLQIVKMPRKGGGQGVVIHTSRPRLPLVARATVLPSRMLDNLNFAPANN